MWGASEMKPPDRPTATACEWDGTKWAPIKIPELSRTGAFGTDLLEIDRLMEANGFLVEGAWGCR